MASNFFTAGVLLNFLLNVLFFSSAPIARSASKPPLPDLCRQTKNPTFCLKVLGSDPRSRTAKDLVDLGQIAIDIAAYNATDTKIKIHSLILGAKDPQLRARYVMCDQYYGNAEDALRNAKDYLKSSAYRDVNVAATSAQVDASDCEDSFKQSPALPSPLTNENLNLGNLCDIIEVISNILSSGK